MCQAVRVGEFKPVACTTFDVVKCFCQVLPQGQDPVFEDEKLASMKRLQMADTDKMLWFAPQKKRVSVVLETTVGDGTSGN